VTESTGSTVGFLPEEELRDAAGSARSRPPRSLQAARELRDTAGPFPFGWFAVAFSRELRPGGVLTRRFMGREIVVFRTRSGIARAIEAYCPHLGAHLGHGGKVAGEELRCPFHGFRFSVTGACVHSPYGAAPPAARLGLLELREIWGAILVWHGPPGQAPWEIDASDDELGWHRLRQRTMTYRCHPQELTENTVDIGHLSVLHGCKENVRLTEELTADGPRLRIGYTVSYPVPLARGIDTTLSIRIHGVGIQVVEFGVPGGWTVRQLVMYTPVDHGETVAHIGSAMRRRGRSVVGKALWSCLEAAIGRGVLYGNVRLLKQDEPIWNNKKYLGRPAIGVGEGLITAYRRWATQFYPDAPER
jgi:nitrite reductase/ring-hydroxylating ferredoxin subunit